MAITVGRIDLRFRAQGFAFDASGLQAAQGLKHCMFKLGEGANGVHEDSKSSN